MRRWSPKCGCCTSGPCLVFSEDFNHTLSSPSKWNSSYVSDGTYVPLTHGQVLFMETVPTIRSDNWRVDIIIRCDTDGDTLDIGALNTVYGGIGTPQTFLIKFGSTGSISETTSTPTYYYQGNIALNTDHTIQLIQCNGRRYVVFNGTPVAFLRHITVQTPSLYFANTGSSGTIKFNDLKMYNFNDGTITGCTSCSEPAIWPNSLNVDCTPYAKDCDPTGGFALTAYKCNGMSSIFILDSVAPPSVIKDQSGTTKFSGSEIVKTYELAISVPWRSTCPTTDYTLDLIQISVCQSIASISDSVFYIQIFKSTDHSKPTMIFNSAGIQYFSPSTTIAVQGSGFASRDGDATCPGPPDVFFAPTWNLVNVTQ